MKNTYKICVAIPTYNRGRILLDTLNQVFSQDIAPDEIVVVDQSDDNDQFVKDQLTELAHANRIILVDQLDPNLPKARNAAVNITSCEIIIFIDDDVEIPQDFVNSHLKNYIYDRSVVAVAGRVEQRLGWPPRKRPKNWIKTLDFKYFALNGLVRHEYIANFPGGNHSVKVKTIKKLGYYDPGYIKNALREESDMSLRIYLSGLKIVYDPNAWLYHISAPAGGCRKISAIDVSGGVCVARFVIKYCRILPLSEIIKELYAQ